MKPKMLFASALLALTLLEEAPTAVAQTQSGVFMPVVQSRGTYRRARRRPYVRRRSARKSAAIVGGSALGGAAIGGLAGGKKGAAIGAIAGGGAGLVYDRNTHKKVVR